MKQMGNLVTKLLKMIPVALKWIIQVGPLVWEAKNWVVKIIKESKRKPSTETDGSNPAEKKQPDPG
jgi:hypothetical protein